MKEAVDRKIPRLQLKPLTDKRMSIVCFGPSLEETWQRIERPIMTCSGAHDFLLEKGIVPDFHVECDPRPHKLRTTRYPHKGVTYLIASCCDPRVWDQLRGHKVFMWHMDNGPETREWVKANDPGGMVLGTGSTVGLRAFHIGGALGYRRFDVYGMDGSYKDGRYRVWDTNAPPQSIYNYKINGRVFKTTDQAINAMSELLGAIQVYGVDVELHGDGMNKAYLDWYKNQSGKKDGD